MTENILSFRNKNINLLNWLNTSKIINICFFILLVVWYWYIMSDMVFWRDEAHSLLIVQNNSIFFDFLKAMRYEGTPILWHFILWITSKFIPLTPLLAKSINFIFFASFIYILLFMIKIPNIFKLFFLLQYPIIYNAVYVRQYQIVSTLILVFIYVYIFKRNILWSCIILFFLTQTCVHGIIISFGLFIFLILNNIKEKHIVYNKYYIIVIFGFLLAVLQIIPPTNLIPGLANWKFRSMEEFFEIKIKILGEALFTNFILELGLLIIFINFIQRNIYKFRYIIINYLFSLSIITIGFLLIGLFKYSSKLHHILLTYLIMMMVIILINYSIKSIKKKQYLYLALLPLLLLSFFQFIEYTKILKHEPRSHVMNVARYLEENFVIKELLVKPEPYTVIIDVYRSKKTPIYSLGRHQYVKYTVWDDHSVDFIMNPLALKLKLNQLLIEINKTPREILLKEPILVLSKSNTNLNISDVELLSQINNLKIKGKFQLNFIKAFTGAQEENYYLYIVKHINEE